MPCNRAGLVVYIERCRQWRPVIAVEHSAAEKLDEPGPMRSAVVIRSKVKAEPATAVRHISFKSGTLLGCVRRVVEPENHLNVLETLRIQIVPVCCGLELKVVSCRNFREKLHRLQSKVNMVAFNISGIKGEHMQWRRLG